ncbi:helix-turn-helix domain-containing protein [Variovorax sp. PAMC26660]|uniref:helix-turn-helix domain-containing protein n=1 Tax=Variovorax sp. PAMC26660 TaxID=2762322 RepID=UPI00164D932F|nr:XRE family transcriptional regulator [Variovorax sp. PAMC26660]QNK68453.1 helix-turn-helix domain-containing protein [Variovorax sp. PAMC26660]
MSLGARIRHYRSKAGLTLEDLSDLSGVEVGTINALENRGSSRSKFSTKLAAAMGMTLEMLEDAEHDYDVRALMAGTAVPSNVTPVPAGTRRIPLVSYIQAGMWAEIIDRFQPGDADDWLTTDQDVSPHTFALQIKGDSMLPEFKEGDRVIIDPDVAPQPGDFVAAKNGEEEATFKKYRPRSMDANGALIFELIPLNDDYPSMRSDVVPIYIVGTMVEHRKYRKPR